MPSACFTDENTEAPKVREKHHPYKTKWHLRRISVCLVLRYSLAHQAEESPRPVPRLQGTQGLPGLDRLSCSSVLPTSAPHNEPLTPWVPRVPPKSY